MVIWLVGLSGSGKTTIGKRLYLALKREKNSTIFVDGDSVRAIFKDDSAVSDYSLPARRRSAERLQALCRMLDQEGMDVVCCAISMFQDINDENRSLYSNYREIFIDVPLNILTKRDNKGLYQAALAGTQSYVVGIDIPYAKPRCADLTIENRFRETDLDDYVENIIKLWEC